MVWGPRMKEQSMRQVWEQGKSGLHTLVVQSMKEQSIEEQSTLEHTVVQGVQGP